MTVVWILKLQAYKTVITYLNTQIRSFGRWIREGFFQLLYILFKFTRELDQNRARYELFKAAKRNRALRLTSVRLTATRLWNSTRQENNQWQFDKAWYWCHLVCGKHKPPDKNLVPNAGRYGSTWFHHVCADSFWWLMGPCTPSRRNGTKIFVNIRKFSENFSLQPGWQK